jgi:hypothetical protein
MQAKHGMRLRWTRYENSAALTQGIYTKHSFDQELFFQSRFASFPKPNSSRIHSNVRRAVRRCRAEVMIDLSASAATWPHVLQAKVKP